MRSLIEEADYDDDNDDDYDNYILLLLLLQISVIIELRAYCLSLIVKLATVKHIYCERYSGDFSIAVGSFSF